jgi:hypothetical protein
MMAEAFVGIDVAFAKEKRLPVCVSTWQDGRLVLMPLRTFGPRFRKKGSVQACVASVDRRFGNS